ncbi:alanine racemase [Bombella sp. TMW 2.2559]|uniref:Alanine racemase n=1 Tax=Bombella dulcis TaxID=2967339 RepID=A0ABT3WFW7_9PROT|nr:alanine racemase [Bombella dulcis]MCX5615776.1 alanine racemase [Bombella dulcis]
MEHSSKQTSARLAVDLSAIRENYACLSRIASRAECAAVVKADAYGLGMEKVAATLADAVQTFFVAHPEEGKMLRAFLPKKRIFILHGFLPGYPEFMTMYNLIPVINSLEQLKGWRSFCQREGKEHPAALQFDTGMSRFGLSCKDLCDEAVIDFRPVLLLSHLACADCPEDIANTEQLRRFLNMTAAFPGVPRSLSASSGIFLGEKYHFDMVRPGIALYGLTPGYESNEFRLAIELEAQILQIRQLCSGDRIGYGLTYRAERSMRVATVGIGYADGIFRSFSEIGALWKDGIRLPIRGRISMDSLSVDVTALRSALLREGAWLSVIRSKQDLMRLADSVGTISYEVLTSLGYRFDRFYRG